MSKVICSLLVVIFLTTVAFGYTDYFTVTGISEYQLISHDRIRITINTGASLFPYSGQIGWRILFSRFYIGDQDPQYEYAVWVLPSQSADLSQEIWFVRPQGLSGEWHYRIDAVNGDRATLATSMELIYTFTEEEEKVYNGILPYAVSDGYYSTGIAFTNATNTDVNLTVKAFDMDGNPYAFFQGTNETTVIVPAHGTYVATVSYLITHSQFYGHLEFEADQPLSWLATFYTTANPVGAMQSGKIE